MKYCSECASPVSLKVPEGDHLPRFVCDSCDTIHYQNPKVITGCIPLWEDKILLCRRAIEPRYGLWTLPAGFMENHETTQQGAARETMEEARATVTSLNLFGVFNIPHISQVYLMFYGQMETDHHGPTHESLETQLFTEATIPWDELAFPVVRESLHLFFADQKKSQTTVHFCDIERDVNNQPVITRYL
jgi:ADP-ribose pyrophosphatase YjhB (NUDIX family)